MRFRYVHQSYKNLVAYCILLLTEPAQTIKETWNFFLSYEDFVI